MENVIDQIEKQILNGILRPHPEQAARVGAGHGGRHCYRLVYKRSFIQAEVLTGQGI